MDLSQIFQVLQSADKQAAATNPYTGFGNISDQIGQLIVKSAAQQNPNGGSRYGLGEIIGAGLVDGLMGGVAQHYGNEYQADQHKMAQDTLMNVFAGNNAPMPENMNKSVWGTMNDAGNIFKAQRQLDSADLQQKSDLQLKQSFMNSLAGAKSPYEREQAIQTGKAMGILPPEFTMGGQEAKPMVEQPAAPQGVFPGGPPSLNSEFDKVFKGFQQQGATANAAMEGATTLTAAKRKAMVGSVDQVKEARDAANALDAIAQTAEAGIQGAGETGGFGWGLKNLASSAYALFSPEEAQQRASQGLLDSVKPDIVKAVRTKGVGAMSDVEMQQYIGAGPSSSNPIETNLLLVDKLKNTASLQRQYADFLDAYREEKGTVQGAEKLWQQYKEANPLFVRDQSGQLNFNSDRPNWQEFFMGGGAQAPAPMTEPMVTIRNKRTGETRQVPRSQLGQ